MKSLRSLALMLLALAVMVSGVTMAQARHQAHAAREVVLCTGNGMVSLQVDAEGNPVGPMLPCPDCINAAAGFDIGPVPGVARLQRLLAAVHPLRDLPAAASGASVHRHARAPPVAV